MLRPWLLRWLRVALGSLRSVLELAIVRIDERTSEPDPRAQDSGDESPGRDGGPPPSSAPPEHWLAMVRERAPGLLRETAERPLDGRRAGEAARRESTPAPGAPEPDPPAATKGGPGPGAAAAEASGRKAAAPGPGSEDRFPRRYFRRRPFPDGSTEAQPAPSRHEASPLHVDGTDGRSRPLDPSRRSAGSARSDTTYPRDGGERHDAWARPALSRHGGTPAPTPHGEEGPRAGRGRAAEEKGAGDADGGARTVPRRLARMLARMPGWEREPTPGPARPHAAGPRGEGAWTPVPTRAGRDGGDAPAADGYGPAWPGEDLRTAGGPGLDPWPALPPDVAVVVDASDRPGRETWDERVRWRRVEREQMGRSWSE